MKGEEWRPIPSFPAYAVSSLGNIQRIAHGGKQARVGYIMSLTMKRGYLVVTLRRNNKTYQRRVNRLVAEAFCGITLDQQSQAAHCDGDKTNNQRGNILWKTPKDNCADRATHGTLASGERNGMAVLTASDVARLRDMAVVPQTQNSDLCREFGISLSQVKKIKAGTSWVVPA